LKKDGPKKGKVLKRPFAKKGAAALTRRNLNKLEDMTLQEKGAKAAEEEEPEAAAESLKKMMSKQEHSKVCSQHQTYLRSQSKQQQKEHEKKAKRRKAKLWPCGSWRKKPPSSTTSPQRWGHKPPTCKGRSG